MVKSAGFILRTAETEKMCFFDIGAFITRSASARNVKTAPEDSEPGNQLEIVLHEHCVRLGPNAEGVM